MQAMRERAERVLGEMEEWVEREMGVHVAWFWAQVALAGCAAAFDRVLSEEFSQDLETWYVDRPGTNLLRVVD